MVLGVGSMPAMGQDVEPEAEVDGEVYADKVSINVQGGNLVQVLSAFWQDALDVILKPYGYGYQQVGEAIVVNALDKFQTVEQQEPLASRVYHLKYLDAAAVQDMIEAQLTARGNWSALTIRGQRGWAYEDTARSGRRGAGGSLDRRQRATIDDKRVLEDIKLRSKTLVVVDTAAVLEKVAAMLQEVDVKPIQILIESRFVEVSSDFLQDIGVEFGTGPNATQVASVQPVNLEGNGNLVGIGVRQTGGGVKPASFAPQTELGGTAPYQAGLSLLFQQLSDLQFEALLHMMEEDVRANLLSSPRVITLNDQEATIMVGTKYPIIQSDTSGSGVSATISTSLDYYENIGIQLNVIPQICDNNSIRMVVNPKVRTLISTTSGKTGEQGNISLTEYPILSTREAETHILVQSGETIVIGGLLEDQESKTTLSVPILGSIPLIGRLFRREAVDNRKMDLLIFLSATIIDSESEMMDEEAMREATNTHIVEMEKATRKLTEARAREKSERMAEEARQEELRRQLQEQERVVAEEQRKAAEEQELKEAEERDRAIEKAKMEQREREQAALEAARAEIAEKLNREETGEGEKVPVGTDDSERESVIKRFPAVGE
jgi:type II secretory pathway component GspD/PulD (secretin)